MNLDAAKRFVGLDHGLVTVSVARPDGSVHSSVVNAGVMHHPVDGGEVVAMVVLGGAYKLRRWREHPIASVVFRAEWQWTGVEGRVSMFGPTDPLDGIDDSDLPTVLRDVFKAAGSIHDNWDEYDRVMRDEPARSCSLSPHT